MPKGPQGQKRPADVVGNAVRVMQIATGEAEENLSMTAKTLLPRRSGPKVEGRAQPS